ncbi:PREDICTED: protein pigeon-like [Ceratosolen solmsi marchali]|uniref:Protein pigeon-like n=1 Tax=Ceratosolen solmsi marchali TaxID=326594 RepID=A0AAJ7E002_9HYME|nr:PREDICTED: protein pigeon-like [Ceratosolen solmsi marchali]
MEENLAAKLCLLLGEQASNAMQWKLLGQEKNGSLLLGWVENVSSDRGDNSYSVIGLYDRVKENLQVLYRFSKVFNFVQASINQCNTLLGYVIKQKSYMHLKEHQTVLSMNCKKVEKTHSHESFNEELLNLDIEFYEAHIIEFKTEVAKIHTLENNKLKQVRLQFLYKEKCLQTLDKLIVLVHQEYIQIYTILYNANLESHMIIELKHETLVKAFIWAQWDATNQVLYHIHHRKTSTSLFTDDSTENSHKSTSVSPTLSGLQFHDDLPHETVLNIPLNLPQSSNSENCGTYEDDVIPLRIHDCSLDLIVISDYKGIICICHYYLYRPVQPPQQVLDSVISNLNTVHFAYSITLLHHSCVIHCVVPGIPWIRAKLMRPTFTLYDDNHMIVFIQDFFTHILDIGLHHQPCCHILCGPLTNVPSQSSYLVPLFNQNNLCDSNNMKTKYSFNADTSINGSSNNTSLLTIDLPTLDLVYLSISTSFLINVFKKITSTEVRLGILHYFLCHKNDLETVAELISAIAEKPRFLDIVKVMQEFLISGTHSLVQKNLPPDALSLLPLVPVTMMEEYAGFEAKINDLNVTLSHEKLWNTSVMLLSPQQRLIPYRSDLWTRLWDLLIKKSDELPRFKPSHIAEKLLVSLACYQPEALSRCTTPMSPSGGFAVTTAALGELMGSWLKYGDYRLPFVEMESCTASKQEHIVSVNLRELSVHLLKYGTQNNLGRFKGSCTPLHVHLLSTRHVASQFETSRLLCQMLCKAANIDSRLELERGFSLVDNLEDSRRWLLFTLLERYRYATESIAFPVPQGFMSFFTYLGYRTLHYSKFLQYVRHSVFELQVDVAKIIMAEHERNVYLISGFIR